MAGMKIKVENPNTTPAQVANQFVQGMYGMSMTDFAKKIIRELQEQKKPNVSGKVVV